MSSKLKTTCLRNSTKLRVLSYFYKATNGLAKVNNLCLNIVENGNFILKQIRYLI